MVDLPCQTKYSNNIFGLAFYFIFHLFALHFNYCCGVFTFHTNQFVFCDMTLSHLKPIIIEFICIFKGSFALRHAYVNILDGYSKSIQILYSLYCTYVQQKCKYQTEFVQIYHNRQWPTTTTKKTAKRLRVLILMSLVLCYN